MSLILRGNVWHYDFIVNGERYRGSTGFSKNEKSKAIKAEENLKVQYREGHSIEMIWEQTRKKISSSKKIPIDFDNLWNIYKSRHKASKKTMSNYMMALKYFVDFSKQNGVKHVGDITEEIVGNFSAYMQSVERAPSTINIFLINIKVIFNRIGEECGLIGNPFSILKKIKFTPDEEREAFTPDELRLIGKHAEGWIFSLCLAAITTGLRKSDICLMKKKNVNLSEDWIKIITKKTKKMVELPILPQLKSHLIEMFEKFPEHEYVFPELARMYLQHPSNITMKMKEFFREIGIKNLEIEVPGYKNKLSKKDIHSFRHTFVYLAAINGIPFPIVQSIVGHSSPAMTRHYMDHARREDKMKYLSEMPTYISSAEHVEVDSPKEKLIDFVNSITPENFYQNKKKLIVLINQL